MTDASSARALDLALEAERQSLARYLELAGKTSDRGGKDMFIRLATDEYHHMRLLEKLRSELDESGQCRSLDVPLSPLERLVPKLEQADRRVRGESGQSELAALELALNAEHSARDFYREQAAAASGPLAAVFERLVAMEQAHADLLQAELDNITQTGFWFGMREFTLESQES